MDIIAVCFSLEDRRSVLKARDIKLMLFAVIIGVFLFSLMTPVIVHGASMSPTYVSRDVLLMNRVSYKVSDPVRGDIIVFKSNIVGSDGKEKYVIKRVVGLPGENITITNGSVYINGDLYYENYLNDKYTDGDVNMTVKEGFYFVLGDNRDISLDSRNELIGLIDNKKIVGKIYFRIM
jgi:signal peptidase I